MMQEVFGHLENPLVILYAIKAADIILHFFHKELRHFNDPDALRRFGICNDISAVQPLVGFVNGQRSLLKIEIARR